MDSDKSAGFFFKNVLNFSYSSIITAALGFFIVPFATRLYDPATMGQINLFTTIAGFGSMVVLSGFDQAYVRYHSEAVDGKALVRDCLLLSLVAWGIVSICLISFHSYVSEQILGTDSLLIVILLVIYIFAVNLLRYSSLQYRVHEEAFHYTVLIILIALANSVLFYFTSLVNKSAIASLAVRTVLLLLLVGLYTFFLQRDFFSSIFYKSSNSERKRILRFGIPLLPASVFYWMNNSVAKFVLSRFHGFEAVGVFSISITLSSIVSIVQTGFNTFWAPYSMKYYKTEKERIQKVHHYIVCILASFVLLLMIFQDLIFYLLGTAYRSSQLIFPFLLLTPVLYTISETTGIGIPISGKTYHQAILSLVSMVLNVVLCFLLIPRFGLIGAMASMLSSDVVVSVLRFVVGQKYYNSVDSIKRTVITLVILFATASFGFVLHKSVRVMLSILNLLFVLALYKKEVYRLFQVTYSVVIQPLFKSKNGYPEES